MTAASEPGRERVLVVAPVGRDGALVQAMLARNGVSAISVRSLSFVVPHIAAEGVGAILLTEEALHDQGAAGFLRMLDEQPPWSDVPILVLSSHHAVSEEARLASGALEERANVTLIERPVRARTLARAAHAALRARRRQYDMREMLARERESRAEVEAASRAKDEFLATVSHELRTPLNAILGWARMSRDGDLTHEQQAHAIETIERNAVAQAQLIEDLLDVSRIVAGTMRLSIQRLELARVIEAARETALPSAENKGIAIDLALDPEASAAMGDAARLRQVVWNLLANAVKFSPRGSRIEVRLELDGANRSRITVSDQGQGIDASFLPHVFERFRQADGSSTRAHGGLGLGLAIVRSITDLHGGAVEATSAGRDRGASFVVRLPRGVWAGAARDPGADAGTSRAEHAARAPSLRGARVMVVDDEPDARDLVGVILGQLGADVASASSVRDALSSVTQRAPDVLVADIGMPGEDGYSLIRAIRSLPPQQGGSVPAIALTAYARPTDRARALAAGFDEYVVKPVDVDTLVGVVERLLRQKRAA